MNSITAIVLMAIGSICAASFYVPIKKVKNWSWESYWIVQGIFSWIIVLILLITPYLYHLLKLTINL